MPSRPFTINEKGNQHRTIGIHFAAAEALSEWMAKADLESGRFDDHYGPHAESPNRANRLA